MRRLISVSFLCSLGQPVFCIARHRYRKQGGSLRAELRQRCPLTTQKLYLQVISRLFHTCTNRSQRHWGFRAVSSLSKQLTRASTSGTSFVSSRTFAHFICSKIPSDPFYVLVANLLANEKQRVSEMILGPSAAIFFLSRQRIASFPLLLAFVLG